MKGQKKKENITGEEKRNHANSENHMILDAPGDHGDYLLTGLLQLDCNFIATVCR